MPRVAPLSDFIQHRRLQSRAAAVAAAAAFTPTSPEEEAFRAALPDSALLTPAGGFRCFPVQCNGTPGLLCMPRDPCGAIQVGYHL